MSNNPDENDSFLPNAWRALLDTIVEGIVVVDEQGIIRHINQYASSHLNIPLKKARERHFRDVFCPSLPMDRCWVNSAIEKHRNIRYHHFRMEEPDGGKRELVANLTMLPANEMGTGALISLRLECESERLREARENHDAILASLSEGLFTVDNEWRITSFNRAAEAITGWQEHQILGKFCKDVIGTEDCIDNCPLAETLKRKKPITDYDLTLSTQNGRKVDVKVNTGVLYDRNSQAIGGVISFRDCSLAPAMSEGDSIRTDFHGIVGKCRPMLEIYQMIQETADSRATVLILGESGTGKELVAKAIRDLSSRNHQPYVRVNCAAIPDTLLESELFGHTKGAFTGALSERIGRFEMAHRGTIFLDEVGDLTPPAQLRLLRVLEQGEYQKLGASETSNVDVRVIAATNRNLWQMVLDGGFRDDLYYRLNVIQLTLPPLRLRVGDLTHLIEHFMQKYRCRYGKPITEISDRAYDLLVAYPYPGNVRELENIIEHSFVRTQGNIITESKLPVDLREGRFMATARSDSSQNIDEAAHLRQVLTQCHWNRQKAAGRLGISRTTLWRRMRELDLFENAN